MENVTKLWVERSGYVRSIKSAEVKTLPLIPMTPLLPHINPLEVYELVEPLTFQIWPYPGISGSVGLYKSKIMEAKRKLLG